MGRSKPKLPEVPLAEIPTSYLKNLKKNKMSSRGLCIPTPPPEVLDDREVLNHVLYVLYARNDDNKGRPLIQLVQWHEINDTKSRRQR